MEIKKSDLNKMSLEELKALKSLIISELNFRYDAHLNWVKSQLVVGGKCFSDHPRAKDKVFVIDKINVKNVKCHEINNPDKRWTISAALLKPIININTKEDEL